MTSLQILKSVREVLQRRSLNGVLGSLCLLAGLQPSTSLAEDALITKIGHFQIPFDVETEPGETVQGYAVLFGSQDGGAHWTQLQSVPASQNSFMFSAPRDGRYSFAIRMTDVQAAVQPPLSGSAPELDIVVDTVAPELRLELFETSPGQVVVNWTCNDASAAADTLTIEYADGVNGRWKSVPAKATANGQSMIRVTAGSVVSVRASISDVAANRADATSQIVTRAVPSSSGNAATVAPQRPPIPIGPSPFSAPAAQPAAGRMTQQAPASASPALPPAVPASPPAMQASPPAVSGPPTLNLGTDSRNSGLNVSFMQGDSVQSIHEPSLHEPSLLETQPSNEQLVSSHIFDVDYQVDDVGPSGVSAVELFVSENGGQQWFRYGNDADLQSPFQVDALSEGSFGFAVRIRNGLGFMSAPPQPGDPPELLVTVDESAPAVELSQPTVRTDGFGTLDLSWRVSDPHPSDAPVRLEYATSPNGPWTPIFDWQVDDGGFQWAIRPDTPPTLHFRLLARDAAGNVGSSQTAEPVIVDLKKPVGRLLKVQAVSHTITPRP